MDLSANNRELDWEGNVKTKVDRMIFDGASTTKLLYPNSGEFNFSGDFCIELFGVRFDVDSGVRSLIAVWHSSTDKGWHITFRGDLSPKRLQMIHTTNGSTSVNTFGGSYNWTPVVGQAYDITAERDGSDCRLYIDGTMVNSNTNSDTFHGSSLDLSVGGVISTTGAEGYLDGSIQAVRITADARYADDGGYTVPTLPLPRSA